MENKIHPTTESELLLWRLDSVNYQDEYNWVQSQFAKLDAAEAMAQEGRA